MREQPGADLATRAGRQLEILCAFAPDRRPGSEGNLAATGHVASVLAAAGWDITRPRFDVVDWRTDGGSISIGGATIEVTPSPYGLGVSTSGPIRIARRSSDLERSDLAGSILILTDELATEPFTPKAFPFYEHEGHAAIIRRLEAVMPAAVVGITGKYPALCGALDPYPLIEDGDFLVPAASVRPEVAVPLLAADGEAAAIDLRSERWVAAAENVIATRGDPHYRVTVIAHIDTKPGTPGAVDNAAGVIVLLLLAEILSPEQHPTLPVGVELLVMNGEDHFAAPGELDWLAANGDRLDEVALVVNIDGAGYTGARSAYSTYNVASDLADHVARSFGDVASIVPGPDWYQSDHAIFAMRGHPAVAITTELVDEMLATLFHAPTDTPDKVDIGLLVDTAHAIARLVTTWPAAQVKS